MTHRSPTFLVYTAPKKLTPSSQEYNNPQEYNQIIKKLTHTSKKRKDLQNHPVPNPQPNYLNTPTLIYNPPKHLLPIFHSLVLLRSRHLSKISPLSTPSIRLTILMPSLIRHNRSFILLTFLGTPQLPGPIVKSKQTNPPQQVLLASHLCPFAAHWFSPPLRARGV